MREFRRISVLRIEETGGRTSVSFEISGCAAKTRCRPERRVLQTAIRLAFADLEDYAEREFRRGWRVSFTTLPSEDRERRISKCLNGVLEAAEPVETPRREPVASAAVHA